MKTPSSGAVLRLAALELDCIGAASANLLPVQTLTTEIKR